MPLPALRRGTPIWLRLDRGRAVDRYPALRGRHEADVAIVGGGITGAMVASRFARAGVTVAVLEAARAGGGSTAASTALQLQEPDLDLSDLTEVYGAKDSRRIWRISFAAAREMTQTLRDLKINCGLVARDSIYYTRSHERARQLQRELALRHKAGLAGDWLTPGQVRRLTGMTMAGAIRTRRNAQLDPYRACLGLLQAAARAGAAIYEHSRVRRIEQRRQGVRVHTRGGAIDAARVVIATGYATRDFKPLAGRFRLRHTYVLATNPVTARDRRELGLGPVMLWDTDRPYHYVRWTPDHRLLLGGADRPMRQGARIDALFAQATHELREYFATHLPATAAIGIDYAWEGLFATTPDGLPYIGSHRRYPRHLFALGYGGNGMTFATIAARMLLEQWQGKTLKDHELFAFNRAR